MDMSIFLSMHFPDTLQGLLEILLKWVPLLLVQLLVSLLFHCWLICLDHEWLRDLHPLSRCILVFVAKLGPMATLDEIVGFTSLTPAVMRNPSWRTHHFVLSYAGERVRRACYPNFPV